MGYPKETADNKLLLRQYIFGLAKISVHANLLSIALYVLFSILYGSTNSIVTIYVILAIIIIYKIIYLLNDNNKKNTFNSSINHFIILIGIAFLLFAFFMQYVVLAFMIITFDFMKVSSLSAVASFRYYVIIPVISSFMAVLFAGRTIGSIGRSSI